MAELEATPPSPHRVYAFFTLAVAFCVAIVFDTLHRAYSVEFEATESCLTHDTLVRASKFLIATGTLARLGVLSMVQYAQQFVLTRESWCFFMFMALNLFANATVNLFMVFILVETPLPVFLCAVMIATPVVQRSWGNLQRAYLLPSGMQLDIRTPCILLCFAMFSTILSLLSADNTQSAVVFGVGLVGVVFFCIYTLWGTDAHETVILPGNDLASPLLVLCIDSLMLQQIFDAERMHCMRMQYVLLNLVFTCFCLSACMETKPVRTASSLAYGTDRKQEWPKARVVVPDAV